MGPRGGRGPFELGTSVVFGAGTSDRLRDLFCNERLRLPYYYSTEFLAKDSASCDTGAFFADFGTHASTTATPPSSVHRIGQTDSPEVDSRIANLVSRTPREKRTDSVTSSSPSRKPDRGHSEHRRLGSVSRATFSFGGTARSQPSIRESSQRIESDRAS